MFVDICVFDESGQHVRLAYNCPHYDPVDEQGVRYPEGWTVQNGAQPEAGSQGA